jgi:hypothetical protein
MIKKVYRTQNIINNKLDLEHLFTVKKAPVYMGVTKKTDFKNFIFSDLKFYISKSSGVVQINPLLPLNIVYSSEHGSGKIGSLWSQHHKNFANFIKKKCTNHFFEIGSGHFQLFEEILKSRKNIFWTALEPNPQKKIKSNKLKILKKFFTKKTTILHDQTIIHSHLLEHIYYPNIFLQNISTKMVKNQLMIFSVPNMNQMIKRGYMNALNFEHTYYASEEIIDHMLYMNNLKVIDKKYFKKDHSIFYRVKKYHSNKSKSINFYKRNKLLFLNYYKNFRDKVLKVNATMNKNNFIYIIHGAHIFTQMAICYGLNINLIQFITDNDPKKFNRFLYGTHLRVKNPKTLLMLKKKICVITIFTGVYKREIENGLLKINKNISFA